MGRFRVIVVIVDICKPLMKALKQMNFEYPTEIQEMSIPSILTGKDVLGTSMTGSGKTAAFLLPVMQNIFK